MTISDPTPTTTHRDYTIRFNEDRGEWECSALQLKSASLAHLRTKINKVMAEASAIEAYPALDISHYGGPREVTIVSTIGLVAARSRYHTDKVKVWATYLDGNSVKRTQVDIESLIPARNNPEIAEYKRLREEKKEADKRLSDFAAKMRRVRLEDLKVPKDEESLP